MVLKTPDGRYHIIDWKTCSWGWDAKKRSDKILAYQLVFYKHFFAGGMGSVRGFESNTLGPRSTPSPQDRFNDPDPIGGNALVELSSEILFPLPFIEDQSQMRSVLFFDAGNVFNTNCPEVSVVCLDLEDGELRYSAGLAVTWITGFAPISFAISVPINEKDGDESESFQFELGKTF